MGLSPSTFSEHSATLLKGQIINIGNGATQLDTRVGKSIYLKGFRLRLHYANKLFRPMVVHMALVTPKYGINDIADTFQPGFFNGLGLGVNSQAKEGLDFNASEQNGVTLATLPINSERWNILQHSRFKLGVISTTGGYSSGELKNYRSMYRYVKINRQIDFDDATSNFPRPDQRVYMLTWAAPMDWEVSQGIIDEALLVMLNVTCVFRRANG